MKFCGDPVVILPIRPMPGSVNHIFPSGPAVIALGEANAESGCRLTIAPAVVMRPTRCPRTTPRQTRCSRPARWRSRSGRYSAWSCRTR